jgi:hypothetical protein
MRAKLVRTWQAQYSPSISGHCDACGKPLNGRDTHETHTVRVYRPDMIQAQNTDYYDYQICDRHKNIPAALRQADKRRHGWAE